MNKKPLANIVKGMMLTASLGVSGLAAAQTTSSSMVGQIVGPNDQPVSNVKIVVVHVPTGTTQTVTTNSEGQYLLPGLRVGGPYKVQIMSDEYATENYSQIVLELGKPYRLNAQLETEEVEELIVTGELVNQESGANGVFGLKVIENTATINRDPKEILRQNPLAVMLDSSDAPLSVAGMNPRYNSFSVDGVQQDDDFGLNGNGYPTQRSPISLDAVEQITISTTPFSARAAGFSGAQINVVTKSGTNDFSGSFFYENANDGFAADPVEPRSDEKVELDFNRTTIGATVSGPIIKDKAFFFVSAEQFEEPQQVEWGPTGANEANSADVSLADVNEVIAIANSVYGVSAGSWDQKPEEKDLKLLTKFDWNITDDHRASLTYQYTEGNLTRNTTSNPSELRLNSHWYDKNETLTSISTQVFSQWSNEFSTEFKLAYKGMETSQDPNSKAFGDITVRTDSGSIAFGADQYRHANALNNDKIQFLASAQYLMGDHQISGGIDYNTIAIENVFVDASLGRWTFDSIDDFRNQNPSSFKYQNAFTNNPSDAAAKFEMGTIALFVEDTWNITYDLDVTFGLRYEQIQAGDKPRLNENFVARYNSTNQENLDGSSLILPRIGFNWQAMDNLLVNGGVGRYSGGRPNVWISNAYTNDGVSKVSYSGSEIPSDITGIPATVQNALEPGDGNTTIISPAFEQPTDWRAMIGAEYTFDIPSFGEDWLVSAQFINVQRENDVLWKDLSRYAVGTTADGGRTIYAPVEAASPDRYDIMLTNADKNGESKIFTTSLGKQFDNGIDLRVSYTNQDITEGTPGNSSRAESNFQYDPVVDRQFATVGTADYEIEHRYQVKFGWTDQLVAGYNTTVDVYFERRSGRPFSWTLGSYRDGDLGDQRSFNSSSYYLPYIPTGANDPAVVYDGTDYAEFSQYISAAGLGKYAGGYADKNTDRTPWIDEMSVRFSQQLPGFMEGQQGEINFTIENLLNMLNENWGGVRVQEFGNKVLVDYDIDDQGRYVYSEPFGGWNDNNWDTFRSEKSTWRMKLGLKYKF